MARVKTLAELNKTNIERAKLDRSLAFSTYPELLLPILLRPCTVRILMVTDDGGSFTNMDFGLTELLDVLSVSPGPFVRFAVTKAHRSTGGVFTANADITGFRFDTTELGQFDQIWMVAVSRGGAQLEEAELEAISRFMDSGGGVFATGDHEQLGVDMCGRVPRVRSMRKWHWPGPGPNGEPVAPGGNDATRLDTNQPGGDASLTFDDQSDDVPQRTMATMYPVRSPSYLFDRVSYPHPLMCGPKGVIRYLPDHPHEGECYVPGDLTKTFTFGAHTITEYPVLSGTTRLPPEIVATSTSGTGITDPGKAALTPRPFGAIGAYDGHRVGVGRVVVQSTWHHLFNINLKGKPGHPDPVKAQGFHASALGLERYEEIKAYFRNVGVWLARPATHACMRWRAIWAVRWDSRIHMDLRPAREIASLDLDELVRVGLVAHDVLGRYASRCQSLAWVLEWLEVANPRLPPELVRPWPPLPDPPPPDPLVFYHAQAMLEASLGALVYATAARFPEATEDARKAADGEGIDRELMADAVKLAETRVVEAAQQSLARLERLVR